MFEFITFNVFPYETYKKSLKIIDINDYLIMITVIKIQLPNLFKVIKEARCLCCFHDRI